MVVIKFSAVRCSVNFWHERPLAMCLSNHLLSVYETSFIKIMKVWNIQAWKYLGGKQSNLNLSIAKYHDTKVLDLPYKAWLRRGLTRTPKLMKKVTSFISSKVLAVFLSLHRLVLICWQCNYWRNLTSFLTAELPDDLHVIHIENTKLKE